MSTIEGDPTSPGGRWARFGGNLAAFAGRLIIVGPLLPNGIGKIGDFKAMAAGMGGVPTILHGHPFPGNPRLFFPVPEFFLTCSILFDLVGAALIICGLFARPVAAWLAFYCLLAIWIYHSDVGDAENLRALLRNIPLVGGLLVIAGLGAGGWSIDAARARRHQHR